jgi:hypothetical protein
MTRHYAYLTRSVIRMSSLFLLSDAKCSLSCRSIKDQTRRSYWDLGPKQIKQYLAHHADSCNENVFCQKLGLDESLDSDQASMPASSPPKARKLMFA